MPVARDPLLTVVKKRRWGFSLLLNKIFPSEWGPVHFLSV